MKLCMYMHYNSPKYKSTLCEYKITMSISAQWPCGREFFAFSASMGFSYQAWIRWLWLERRGGWWILQSTSISLLLLDGSTYLCFTLHLILMWRTIKILNWTHSKNICVPPAPSSLCLQQAVSESSSPTLAPNIALTYACVYILNLILCQWFLSPALDITWLAADSLHSGKP